MSLDVFDPREGEERRSGEGPFQHGDETGKADAVKRGRAPVVSGCEAPFRRSMRRFSAGRRGFGRVVRSRD